MQRLRPTSVGPKTTHIDHMMRTEEPRPVRLSEYRPPDWLVETVDLQVNLHPKETPVRATLKLKPNPQAGAPAPRSEEHTSELQSPCNLVCRLLLEKKKKK